MKKRTVRREFFLSPHSSWHCAETTAFLDHLGNYKSGIGRKTLKGALLWKSHSVNIKPKDQLCVSYVFPAEIDGELLVSVCKSWNTENTTAFASPSVSCKEDGTIFKRVIFLDLLGWEIEKDPKEVENA